MDKMLNEEFHNFYSQIIIIIIIIIISSSSSSSFLLVSLNQGCSGQNVQPACGKRDAQFLFKKPQVKIAI
jgi:hypothetical protein